MSRSSLRIAFGLILAVTVAWGMSLDTRAAATTAANAPATVVTGGVLPAGTPAGEPEPIPSRSLAGVFMTDASAAGAAQAAGSQGKAKKGPVTRDQLYPEKFQKVAPSEQKAAAQRAAALGMLPGAAGLTDVGVAAAAFAPLPGIEGPGGVPHYFGPYGNWAFSPLPSYPVAIDVVNGGSGYVAPVVTVTDVYGTGTVAATAVLDVNGTITGITIDTSVVPNEGFHVPFITITDDPLQCGGTNPDGTPQPACGTGATATVALDLTAPPAGGIRKFVDRLPGLGPTAANNITQTHGSGQYIPVAIADTVAYPATPATATSLAKPASDYYEIALVEYSEKLHSDLPPTRLRGYVQLETPGTLAAMAAMTPPMVSKHIDVGSGKFAIDDPHYLGPVIVAQGRVHGIQSADPAVVDPGDPRPVRVRFYNLLPTGAAGNLFIPVDETVPGSGYGPSVAGAPPDAKYSQNRATIHLHGNNTIWLSDGNTHQWITPAGEPTAYPAGTSARNVPDMDGCASDPTNPLLPGSSGCMTFYYTNAQSARLQFYHDHAHGITRLNVYAGEAGGYVVTDAVEQDLINGTNVTGVNINCTDGTDPDTLPGTSPGECAQVLPGLGIPLIIQDKAFVDAETVYAQDPTWNWGTAGSGVARTGDLWYPHVYMTVQNPWDLTGTNGFGRWHYGPWFNPPTPECVNGGPVGCIEVGPVPNEYYQPVCDGLPDPINATCTDPWEPPMRPGVPNPSIPGESFLDTPLVNGTAYPYVVVEPKAYRFRVLNAANDRFWNLQLYEAFDKANFHFGTGPNDPSTAVGVTDPTTGAFIQPCAPLTAATLEGPSSCTELKMIPVAGQPNQLADIASGIPDPAFKGPDWIMIGTEGGFLPKPIVVPQQPIGWNLDMAYFAFGVVNQHSLYLGSAERADVIVDFTGQAGKTFIVYNDSPAPVPAGAAPYDNYTGDGDLVDAGGAPNTQPGYGPNTRTVMQIRVAPAVTTPTPDVTLANLEAVWAKNTATLKRGVFEVSQDPIVVPQAAYNSAYNASYPTNASQYVLNVGDRQKSFTPIDANGVTGAAVTIPFEMKGMHDEMGGVYDTMFGRMSGMLGLTNPNSAVNLLIPYGYSAPPTDIVKGSIEKTMVGSLADGTQIWRIFHNGVDTHPIHTHLFHAQLINRVDQSGQVTAGTLPVDEMDLGWKDTIKINPLEITFLALRPTVPTPDQVPFEVPNSIRLIDPGLPEGANLIPPAPAGWQTPNGVPLPDLRNHTVNFGWEYVWHCHILSHEEMDFMHALAFAVPPLAPTDFTAAATTTNNPVVVINWTDNSTQEEKFTIQRATNSSFTAGLTNIPFVPADPTTKGPLSYTDSTVARDTAYWYRLFANGPVVGDVATAGFPTMSADSIATIRGGTATVVQVTTGTPPTAPAAPTNFTATLQAGPQARLTWTDNARNETGFVVERCTVTPTNACTDPTNGFVQIASPGPRNNTGSVTYTDTTVVFRNTYVYRVGAFNAGGTSYATTLRTVAVTAPPVAPTAFTVTAAPAGNRYTATFNWVWADPNDPIGPTGFTIQRATNLAFTAGVTNLTVTPGTARTATQTGLARNTVYYYRIRANNAAGSSAWTNALPFPIRTGN